MQEDNKYIIEGGKEGKKRLDVLGEILDGYTRKLMVQDGPVEGKVFLDVGCGGGNVSRMMAELAGKSGKVVGVDFDEEIVTLARQEATDKNNENISFRALNAYELDYNSHFDVAYARFLLSHLDNPRQVVQNMIRALKPGGRLIIEDIDFSGHFCFPPCPAFDRYLYYFTTAAQNNGQNPDIGLALFNLLKGTELDQVGFDLIQPAFSEGAGKWMGYYTMEKIKETVIRQNLATAAEISEVLEELEAFTRDENTLISLPRIFRVWGIKKQES